VVLVRLVTMADEKANLFGIRATLGYANPQYIATNLGVPVKQVKDTISDLRSDLGFFHLFNSNEENLEMVKRARELLSNNYKPEEPKLKSTRVRTATRKLPQNKKSGGKVYSRGSRKAKFNG
jgi:hypothetical protein